MTQKPPNFHGQNHPSDRGGTRIIQCFFFWGGEKWFQRYAQGRLTAISILCDVERMMLISLQLLQLFNFIFHYSLSTLLDGGIHSFDWSVTLKDYGARKRTAWVTRLKQYQRIWMGQVSHTWLI